MHVIRTHPADETKMRPTVLLLPDRRWHIHDSLDQLGLFQVRHGFVTAFEFVTAQTLAILQRNGLAVNNHFHHESLPYFPKNTFAVFVVSSSSLFHKSSRFFRMRRLASLRKYLPAWVSRSTSAGL